MLAEMEPAEFDERYASYLIRPWGHEIEVASTIGAAILNELRRNVPDATPLADNHFIPRAVDETRSVASSSVDSYFASMRSRILREH